MYMKLNTFKLLLVLMITCINCNSIRSQTIDSLMQLHAKSNQDTTKIRLLLNVVEQLYMQNPDSAERTLNSCIKQSEKQLKDKSISNAHRSAYNKLCAYAYTNLSVIRIMLGKTDEALELNYKSIPILIKEKDDQGLGNAFANISQFFYMIGNMDSATYYAEKSLKLFKKVKSIPYTSVALNNLGLFYDMKGDFNKALTYYLESLKLQEQLKDKRGIAYVLHNLGGVYKSQKDLDKALEYHEKSLKLRKEINDQYGIAESLINIGSIKLKKGDKKTALECYNNALAIQKTINDIKGIALSYNNIGNLYNEMGDKKNAGEYLMKSLEIQEKIGDKLGLAYSYNNLSVMYYNANDYSKAIIYSQKSLELGEELGFPENIKIAAYQLYNIYSKKGNFQLALDNYKIFIKMRDSLNNIETQKSLIQQQTKYEYQQKKAIADAEHKAELKQQEELASIEKNKQNIVIASVSLVLILVVVFSVFLYNRFKITQKQKQIIELKEKETHEQKLIIEEKHKEITDSINYAERIQRSFLATNDFLDQNLTSNKQKPNYFIFYKPKDIVSGDFYWASNLLNGNFAFVTADSTGHGVPGAIMSLLNITSLEKAIEQHSKPHDILNATRNIIIDRLKKDGSVSGGKDGMDCSFLSFDFKNKKMEIAAAHNPVWIIRNNELIEIRPDKMPVGKSDHQNESFTLHTIDLQSGDMIYTLTDGFADQFGGPLGKKFKSKNLKDLLLKQSSHPIEIQKQALETEFKNWIGALEQIDDVTLIGISIA